MITAADMKLYKSQVVNDTGTNGGRMSSNQVTSGAAANLFPAAGETERTAGSQKFRKVFFKVASDDGNSLMNPKVFFDNYTPAQDMLFFMPSNQTETQSGIDTDLSNNDLYGCGSLNATVDSGDSIIVVDTESDVYPIFRDGDVIRITNKATIDAVGNEEYGEIDSVVWTGPQAFITLVDPLVNGYTAADTRVMSVVEPVDISAAYDDESVESEGSDAGAIDFSFLTFNNIGAVQDTWTLTKIITGEWDVTGAITGGLGYFDAEGMGGIEPNNPAFTKPYFSLSIDGFSGVFATGDVIIFTTTPASTALWVIRNVPAGADVFGSGNTATLVLRGEALG